MKVEGVRQEMQSNVFSLHMLYNNTHYVVVKREREGEREGERGRAKECKECIIQMA